MHGRGPAHAEHQAVPRAAGVRHQPRRGPGHHRRRVDHPAPRPGSRPADHGQAHHRQGRRRHLAARRDARLRHVAGGRAAGFRLPRPRRTHGDGDVLHERHDRQPEGCDVQPSQHLPAFDDGHLDCQHRARRDRPDAGDRADVPRQRLGHAVRGVDGGRRPGVPAAVPAGSTAGPHDRRDQADADRCGAHRADRPAPQRQRRGPLLAAFGDVWRIGRSPNADRGLSRRVCRARGAGLGDDRDQPGVRDRSPTEEPGRPRRGHLAIADRSGPARRRTADHR